MKEAQAWVLEVTDDIFRSTVLADLLLGGSESHQLGEREKALQQGRATVRWLDPQSSRPTLLLSGAAGGPLGCCGGLFYVSTRMGHGVPRYAVKRYSGCVCGGRFWMRLILESVDWIRKSALPTVGGPYQIS